ncbi:hypothetical protein GCM10027592_29080 [Spirosoma flavus]
MKTYANLEQTDPVTPPANSVVEAMNHVNQSVAQLSEAIRAAQQLGVHVSLSKAPKESGCLFQLVYLINSSPT